MHLAASFHLDVSSNNTLKMCTPFCLHDWVQHFDETLVERMAMPIMRSLYHTKAPAVQKQPVLAFAFACQQGLKQVPA